MDMQTLYYVIAAVLILVGVAGTVLPALPGLPLVFGGMLLAAWAGGFEQVGVGMLVLLERPNHLLLDNIAVAPDSHGRGIGRALLRFAEAEARRRGHRELRLYTHEMMTENIALYARAGWTLTGRAVQDGFSRLFFRKELAPEDAD